MNQSEKEIRERLAAGQQGFSAEDVRELLDAIDTLREAMKVKVDLVPTLADISPYSSATTFNLNYLTSGKDD